MTKPEDVAAAFPELADIAPIGAPSGQKEVFRASKGGHLVVVKLVKPARDPKGPEARAEREVQAAATLRSAYVPLVHEFGHRTVSGVERIFIVEDHVAGRTLADELRARNGPLALPEVVQLARALLGACTDFARAALVHRDIKPSNLILDPAGKVWVIDFGLVRFLDLESLTATAAHFGPFTPGYAPPEQCRNQKLDVDQRADLFAVGIVLHEALRGRNFHWEGGDPIQALRSVETRDLPSIAVSGDHGGRFMELVLALGSRFLGRRPRTADDALAWFEEVATHLAKGAPSA